MLSCECINKEKKVAFGKTSFPTGQSLVKRFGVLMGALST